MMKVAKLFVCLPISIGLAGCERGPSAKEVFDLRSQCRVLVAQWEAERDRSGIYYIADAWYDVSSNRCLARASGTGEYAGELLLVDVQTDKLLAGCSPLRTKLNKSPCFIGSDQDVALEEGRRRIYENSGG